MKKRLLLVLVAILAGSVLVILLASRSSQQFYYRGRALKDWSKQAFAGDSNAVSALKVLGPKAVPKLTKLLQYQDSVARKRIWSYYPTLPAHYRQVAWQKVGPPLAVNVREAAARSLGIIGPDAKAAVPALAQAMQDREGRVCWEAATALGRVGKDSVSYLTNALQEKDTTIRHAAAYALGEVGPQAEAAIPALIQSLSDTNEGVRNSTAYSLSRIGDPAVLALVEQIGRGNEDSRQATAQALARFDGWLQSPVLSLSRMTSAQDPVTRRRAIEALGTLRSPRSVAFKALIAALDDPILEIRLAAIKTLTLFGPRAQRAMPQLTRLAADQDQTISLAAKEALAAIQ